MASNATTLRRVSGFFGIFRWAFMPLGLFALIAVGVHAAADLVDDRLLSVIEQLDAWLDGLLAQSDATAAWVNRIDTRERTLIARALALAWELGVDAFIAIPALGYDEQDAQDRKFSFRKETWRALFTRLNQKPTPMRVLRPLVTAVFVLGGAYAVARLVESTAFVGLVGDVAPADAAQVIARVLGALAMVIVLLSHGWRAVLRSLQHADQKCEQQELKAATPLDAIAAITAAKPLKRPSRLRPWLIGAWGNALSLPLAAALVLEARSLLSFVL